MPLSQCSRCLWSRTNLIEVYYERPADIPLHLRGGAVENLKCPSIDWNQFYPTKVIFAMLDAYVSQYVRTGQNKASNAHRARVALGDDQSSQSLALFYVSESQQDVYSGDGPDEDAANIFAAERRSTLLTVAKRGELIAKQGNFFKDLLEQVPSEQRHSLSISLAMLN